jgi:serine/threonine-protein kinase RsbW
VASDPRVVVDVDVPAADGALDHALDLVHDALAALWRGAVAGGVGEVGEEDRIAVETAVVEVAGNVLQHGGGEDGWHVRLSADTRAVVAVLSQPGPPPDVDLDAAMPSTDAESGRGLPLTRMLVDDLACASYGGTTWWTLTRHRRP